MQAARPLLHALIALSFSFAAEAVVITVDTTADELTTNGQCSLREAVQAANTDGAVDSCTAGSGADVIELPLATYGLTLTGSGEDANATGDLDVIEDLEIVGTGSARSVIEWSTTDNRILHVRCTASSDVTLTLRNVGLHDATIGDEPGGALLVEDCASALAHATLENMEVDTCAAAYTSQPADPRPGGAITFDSAGQLTVRDSWVHGSTFFTDGSAAMGSFGGGAIGMTGGGNLLVEDSRLSLNTAWQLSGDDPSGGAIWTDTFTTIRGTTFDENLAFRRGGAIYCESALMLIENSTLSDNNASRGGGFGNGVGGAPGCLVTIDSSTVVDNSASQGGGLYNETGGLGVGNTIVAGNFDISGADDVSGAFTSNDHNLIGSADGSTGFTEPNDLTGTFASPVDPLIGVLGAEGFAVPTHALLPGSPALDSGSTALAIDQRGLPRGSFGVDSDRGAAEDLNDNFGIYLDVATYAGSPSSSYAAAATEAGSWNALSIGTSPVTERGGTDVGAMVEIASQSSGGIGAGATDAARLFIDDARDCTLLDEWSVDFTGLPDADYLVLVYAPATDGRSTGDIDVDGAALGPLPGGSFDLEAGFNWDVAAATVSGGTLPVSGSDGTTSDCAGVAGVQVLPEVDRRSALAIACALLFRLSRRTRGLRSGVRGKIDGA